MSAGQAQTAVVPNKYLVAATVMIGTLMEVIDTSVANVSLPHMQGTFSAGVDEITWVITSYLVANAILLPLSGWLGHYYGRKRSSWNRSPRKSTARPWLCSGWV